MRSLRTGMGMIDLVGVMQSDKDEVHHRTSTGTKPNTAKHTQIQANTRVCSHGHTVCTLRLNADLSPRPTHSTLFDGDRAVLQVTALCDDQVAQMSISRSCCNSSLAGLSESASASFLRFSVRFHS